MHKKFVPISIFTIVMMVLAGIGYLYPTSSEALPTRILLDNKGGKVIFSHLKHADLGSTTCASCHHTSKDDKTPPNCTSCHPAEFDKNWVAAHQTSFKDNKYCGSCHHAKAPASNFDHDGHKEYADDNCQACHHDSSIEPEPTNCSECHDKKGDDDTPSLKKAVHAKCADCHEDLFDAGIKSCSDCHVRTDVPLKKTEYVKCASCHTTPVDKMIPTRTTAFHDQCMDCHKKSGKGPFGKEACKQCHIQ